jgi:hypothetical protein
VSPDQRARRIPCASRQFRARGADAGWTLLFICFGVSPETADALEDSFRFREEFVSDL